MANYAEIHRDLDSSIKLWGDVLKESIFSCKMVWTLTKY